MSEFNSHDRAPDCDVTIEIPVSRGHHTDSNDMYLKSIGKTDKSELSHDLGEKRTRAIMDCINTAAVKYFRRKELEDNLPKEFDHSTRKRTQPAFPWCTVAEICSSNAGTGSQNGQTNFETKHRPQANQIDNRGEVSYATFGTGLRKAMQADPSMHNHIILHLRRQNSRLQAQLKARQNAIEDINAELDDVGDLIHNIQEQRAWSANAHGIESGNNEVEAEIDIASDMARAESREPCGVREDGS